ncbi:MAG: hypothetical protein K2Y56_12880 [Methylobacterium sp.]|uniref:hypothetical protein n=1 Tax=Methylobacterium sp. TaxID=409 RepID=UPI0025D070B7|nr:hypothetical protein [Methylobacterium sp.]MBX9932414.1 hypothetical protein [Methylobacterium sp.]
MKTMSSTNDLSVFPGQIDGVGAKTGPSFAAALCGFVSTTVATTMLMFLLSSV